METVVLTSIISALSAIFGGAVAGFVQWRLAKENHRFNLISEANKFNVETVDKSIREVKDKFRIVHQGINKIARDFSTTSLDIILRSGITDQDYDKRYLESCLLLDDLRANCDLHFPEVSENLERIYSDMNHYWGNLNELVRLYAKDERNETKQYFHEGVVRAGQSISENSKNAKAKLVISIKSYIGAANNSLQGDVEKRRA